MSVTFALNRIYRWAEQHDPAFIASLQSGLTRQEIDTAVGGLPFALAEEVYELYQWRNGQDWGQFRLGLGRSSQERFLPLAEAVHEWDTYLNESYADEVENMNPVAAAVGGWHPAAHEVLEAGGWLPVLEMDSDFHASLGTQTGALSSPIAYVSHDDCSAIFYPSLTVMLEYNADIYEAEALRTDEQGGDFFDYTITSALTRNHFPDKVMEAEEAYRSKCSLPAHRTVGTPDRPTQEEFAQFDLISKLVQAGSLQAIPATERYLEWLLGDAEQAKQIAQDLVKSPYSVMYGWPHERSLLVHNFSYSYTL